MKKCSGGPAIECPFRVDGVELAQVTVCNARHEGPFRPVCGKGKVVYVGDRELVGPDAAAILALASQGVFWAVRDVAGKIVANVEQMELGQAAANFMERSLPKEPEMEEIDPF